MSAPIDPRDRRCASHAVDARPETAGIYRRTAHLPGRSHPGPARLDWPSMKQRIDLAVVATDLMGASRKSGGSGRLWWLCPFHPDRNPSFCVTPGRSEWRCFGCGKRGDAAALVMKLQNVTFPEAVRRLGSEWAAGGPRLAGGDWRVSGKCDPAASSTSDTYHASPVAQRAVRTSGLRPAEAASLVERGQERLWSREGLPYRRTLHLRGLTGATIWAARLGWTSGVTIPTGSEIRSFRASGLIIPWFEGDRLTMAKIRQPSGRKPKYVEAFRDGPGVYPSRAMVLAASPLIVVEGELDALLLGQELCGIANVITMGSASARSGLDLRWELAAATPIFAAHDADPAGDRAAGEWPAPAIRVKSPVGKDWTDARRAGVDLRRWWIEEVFSLNGPFASEERAAIRESDAGLTREAVEGTTEMRSSAIEESQR